MKMACEEAEVRRIPRMGFRQDQRDVESDFLGGGCSFRSTTLPSCQTMNGVPVWTAKAQALFAARRKAASTSRKVLSVSIAYLEQNQFLVRVIESHPLVDQGAVLFPKVCKSRVEAAEDRLTGNIVAAERDSRRDP